MIADPDVLIGYLLPTTLLLSYRYSPAECAILVINPIIYAEISIGFERIEQLEIALPPDINRRDPLPYQAAFLAGKAFLRYRKRGGSKPSPLPDFYIGARAAIADFRLLTRDPTRYRTYFPTLNLHRPLMKPRTRLFPS